MLLCICSFTHLFTCFDWFSVDLFSCLLFTWLYIRIFIYIYIYIWQRTTARQLAANELHRGLELDTEDAVGRLREACTVFEQHSTQCLHDLSILTTPYNQHQTSSTSARTASGFAVDSDEFCASPMQRLTGSLNSNINISTPARHVTSSVPKSTPQSMVQTPMQSTSRSADQQHNIFEESNLGSRSTTKALASSRLRETNISSNSISISIGSSSSSSRNINSMSNLKHAKGLHDCVGANLGDVKLLFKALARLELERVAQEFEENTTWFQ